MHTIIEFGNEHPLGLARTFSSIYSNMPWIVLLFVSHKRLHRFMSCRIEFLIKLSQISGMFMKRKESFVMFTARLFTSISLVSSWLILCVFINVNAIIFHDFWERLSSHHHNEFMIKYQVSLCLFIIIKQLICQHGHQLILF